MRHGGRIAQRRDDLHRVVLEGIDRLIVDRPRKHHRKGCLAAEFKRDRASRVTIRDLRLNCPAPIEYPCLPAIQRKSLVRQANRQRDSAQIQRAFRTGKPECHPINPEDPVRADPVRRERFRIRFKF